MFVCDNFVPFQCLQKEHFQWLKNKRIENETLDDELFLKIVYPYRTCQQIILWHCNRQEHLEW